MSPMHLLNLAVHVGAGVAAMALGFYLVATVKGTARHRRLGRVFGWLGLVVSASAVVGLVLFRFLPMFAVLSVLIAFQLLSGWHVIYTKAAGPNGVDALMLAVAAGAGVLLAPQALGATAATGGAPVVVYSSLGALASVLLYEALRWVFPRAWHGALWRYEHIYKLLAALFGMLSAAVGNTVRAGQPWSQVLPSALGLAVIVFFWVRNYRAQRALARSADAIGAQARPAA
jgi:uncharacterized membrane protein